MAYRPTLRQDAIRWLRERRTQLYVDLLTEAHAAVAINLIVLVLVSGTAGGLIRPRPGKLPRWHYQLQRRFPAESGNSRLRRSRDAWPCRRTPRRDGTGEKAARRARSEISDQGAIKGCLADEPP